MAVKLDPMRLISLVPIMTYHHVADIGCGNGHFTIPLGKYLFDGKVYALDTEQEKLDATREALKAINLTNVELIQSAKGAKLPLEDESLDGALLSRVLHHVEDPEAMLEDTRRCMRKSAWLAILERHERADAEGRPQGARKDEDDVRSMADKLGFRLSSRYDIHDKCYMLVMRK